MNHYTSLIHIACGQTGHGLGSVALLDRYRVTVHPIGEDCMPAALKQCHTATGPSQNRATSLRIRVPKARVNAISGETARRPTGEDR